jgi:hypothetical protein
VWAQLTKPYSSIKRLQISGWRGSVNTTAIIQQYSPIRNIALARMSRKVKKPVEERVISVSDP